MIDQKYLPKNSSSLWLDCPISLSHIPARIYGRQAEKPKAASRLVSLAIDESNLAIDQSNLVAAASQQILNRNQLMLQILS